MLAKGHHLETDVDPVPNGERELDFAFEIKMIWLTVLGNVEGDHTFSEIAREDIFHEESVPLGIGVETLPISKDERPIMEWSTVYI
ncbi:MAG: hypothetical protein QOG04_242 [Actinomycetota bacterium]|nr:hypothetical protein [Actinomycetota bacterium]